MQHLFALIKSIIEQLFYMIVTYFQVSCEKSNDLYIICAYYFLPLQIICYLWLSINYTKKGKSTPDNLIHLISYVSIFCVYIINIAHRRTMEEMMSGNNTWQKMAAKQSRTYRPRDTLLALYRFLSKLFRFVFELISCCNSSVRF